MPKRNPDSPGEGRILALFAAAEQQGEYTTPPLPSKRDAHRLRFLLHQWRARHRRAGTLPAFAERVSVGVHETDDGWCVTASTTAATSNLLAYLPDAGTFDPPPPPAEVSPGISPTITEEEADDEYRRLYNFEG